MQGTAKARPYCQGGNPNRPSISTASSGSAAMIRLLTRTVLKNSGLSSALPRMWRQPSNSSPFLRPAGRSACSGLGSVPPMARIPHADSRKLAASATMVVTGPNSPTSRPPSGGPSTMDVQLVDSKRAFATSRSSGRTNDFRHAPLADLNAMSAALTTTDTTMSCAKLSSPRAKASGTLSSAAQRARSAPIMTGRLRRNSTQGASGIASSAPTAPPAAEIADTSMELPCSTTITTSGNAPKDSPVPSVLTTYADHSQRNSRPGEFRAAAMLAPSPFELPPVDRAIKPAPRHAPQTTAPPPGHNPALYL